MTVAMTIARTTGPVDLRAQPLRASFGRVGQVRCKRRGAHGMYMPMGKTKLTQILLKLEPETLARLDALVKSSGKTRITIVREALANFLADQDLNAEREAV